MKKEEVIMGLYAMRLQGKNRVAKERNNTVDRAVSLINQLDEPETLSEEWIENHTASADTISYYSEENVPVVTVEKLKNLLAPKQDKPVIPKFVAEFLDGKEDYMLYELFDDKWLYNEHDQIAKWLYDNDEYINREREADLALAHRHGYEVEKEQKYILSINITHKESNTNYETFLNKRGIFHSMENESFNSEEFNWTEEEIKDLESGEILFEHFATKVEELEE